MTLARVGIGVILVAVLCSAACDDTGGNKDGSGGEVDDGGGAGSGESVGGEPGVAGGAEAGGGDSGGSGGEGGNDDAAPVVLGEDCDGQPYELDAEQTRRCVLLASCAGPSFGPFIDDFGGNLSVSSCLRQGAAFTSFQFYDPPQAKPVQFDARVSACPIDIQSCEDVLACAGFRSALSECEEGVTRCEGELAITCGAQVAVTDCERTTGKAGSCRVLGEGVDQRAVCVVNDECTEPLNAQGCDGETLFRCAEGGVAEGTDCEQFGLTCDVSAEKSYARCIEPPPAETCATPGAAACDGNTQTFCSSDGLLYKHACPAGLACAEGGGDRNTDGVWLDCVPAGCGTLLDEVEACNGDDLITDFGLTLHCPDYGFTTCKDGRCAN